MPQGSRDTLTATTDGAIRYTESGDGFRRGYILEQIVHAAAAEGTLKTKLPANAHVDYYEFKNVTAITLVTGTGLGLGTSADPDAIGEIGSITTTINTISTEVTTPTRLSRTAESDLVITSTNSSGTEAGTWAGTLDAVVHFIQYQGIDQAIPGA